jgi:predicted TIM-barrel fold metal-dependent hydrolase
VHKANSKRSDLYQRLRQELGAIPLVDAHEHILSEEQWLIPDPRAPVRYGRAGDFTMLLGYVHGDLVSAGMSKDALVPGMNSSEKWEQIRPYWRYVRHMGGGSLCRRALAIFCSVDDLDDATIPAIEERLATLNRPGIYRRLFKGEYNVATCVTVSSRAEPMSKTSRQFFAPLLYTSDLAMVHSRSDIHRLERATNQDIYSLKTYLNAVDSVLERAWQNGFVGIKWHRLAYLRDIRYPLEGTSGAERCLNRILRRPARGGIGSDVPVGFEEMCPFQNYVQHYLVQKAIELNWPVQIHTGIQGGSHGAQISHTNPTHLVDLFLQYPQARFDLLHASYPYMRELTALVKLFPNVYINTSWFDLLSPWAARAYLREWISSVPFNKILLGGDQFNVLLVCAYAEMLRDHLAEVLTAEVDAKNLSEDQALDIASHLMRHNAWEYFDLQDRWAKRL